jgi:hypothetical protein
MSHYLEGLLVSAEPRGVLPTRHHSAQPVVFYFFNLITVRAHGENHLMGMSMRPAGNEGFETLYAVD